MEFDIGNILYIIITLVAVTVGLLGKKKKRQGQTDGESTGEAQPGFLESLEKLFNPGQQEQMVRDLQDHEQDLSFEEEYVEPTPAARPQSSSFMKEYEPSQMQRKEYGRRGANLSQSDDAHYYVEQFHSDENEGTDFFEVVKDFDAGTAVVYSAIINRIDY